MVMMDDSLKDSAADGRGRMVMMMTVDDGADADAGDDGT